MVLELVNGKMVHHILVIGLKMSDMEMENLLHRKVMYILASL